MSGVLNGGYLRVNQPIKLLIDGYDFEFILQEDGDINIYNGYLKMLEVISSEDYSCSAGGITHIKFSGKNTKEMTFFMDNVKKQEKTTVKPKKAKPRIKTNKKKNNSKRLIIGAIGTVAGALVLVGVGKNVISKHIEPAKIVNDVIGSVQDSKNDEMYNKKPIDISNEVFDSFLEYKEKIKNLEVMNDEEKRNFGFETIVLQGRILNGKIAYALGMDEKDISILANGDKNEIVIFNGKNVDESKTFRYDSTKYSFSKEIDKYLECIKKINSKIENEDIDTFDFEKNLKNIENMAFSRLSIYRNYKGKELNMQVEKNKVETVDLGTETNYIYDYDDGR